jgi:choline dehydrogenase
MDHGNVTVLTEAQAVQLTLSGTRCTGVDFLLDGRPHSVGASGEMILSVGVIHTPGYLQESCLEFCRRQFSG